MERLGEDESEGSQSGTLSGFFCDVDGSSGVYNPGLSFGSPLGMG